MNPYCRQLYKIDIFSVMWHVLSRQTRKKVPGHHFHNLSMDNGLQGPLSRSGVSGAATGACQFPNGRLIFDPIEILIFSLAML
jgi:hypothetical protein